MIITKKRIRNLEKHMKLVESDSQIFVGISDPLRFPDLITKIGFPTKLNVGDVVLPATDFGTISHYNAHGKYFKLKTEPLEIAYRQCEWHWKDWGGYNHYKIVDVPYKRYPRKFIKPLGIEFQIRKNSQDKIILTNHIPLTYSQENNEIITHTINLFLEIFSECEIFESNLDSFTKTPIKRLNWDILPKGKYPWDKIKHDLAPILNKIKKGNHPMVIDRLSKFSNMNPDFVAIGRAGFHGYVVYGYKDRNLFVFESIHYGNATYIFEKDWESLSQFTKAEILDSNLQKYRIIHQKNWQREVETIFSNNQNFKLVG